MNKLRLSAVWAVASALLAGCGGGGSNGIPKISTVNPIQTGKLQFAVGTANLYGTNTGLNVVSTYRQANGLSNVTVDTPTITGPFKLPAAAAITSPGNGLSFDPYSTLPQGPSAQEVSVGGEIIGTSQTVHPGTPACDQALPCTIPNPSGGTVTIPPNTSTFGQAGGVFTNGISPGDYTSQGVAASFVPYTEPLYDSNVAEEFVPFGGPPSFDPNHDGLGLRDGLFNLGAGVLGIPLGISTFDNVVVAAGTYTLSVQVPTGFSGQTPTSATTAVAAHLGSTALLGTIAAPVLALDTSGGGTFTVAPFPTGVTEEIVQIVDFGTASGVSCQGAIGASEGAGPVYYTFVETAPGAYTLPSMIGPNTTINSGKSVITPSPSICTAAQNTAAAGTATPADSYTVQAIGADYPLFESLYPNSVSQTPTIVGSTGQSDITISPITAVGFTSSSHARRVLRGVKTVKHT